MIIEQRTRKLNAMHKAVHPLDDRGILFVLRKEGGRRFTSTENSVDTLISRLAGNIKNK